MSDKTIITSESELHRIVNESVKQAIDGMQLVEKYIDEAEAMAILFIKDKRTLKKRVLNNKIEAFFIGNKKVYKEKDIKSIIK